MKTRLRVVAGGWAELSAHLFPGDDREHAAFLPAVFEVTPNGVEVLAGAPILISDEELVGGADSQHLEVGPPALLRVVNEAVRRGVGLIEVHNHSPEFPAGFSRWDRAGFRSVVPYMQSSLPGRSYGALVLGGETNADGVLWLKSGEVVLDEIEVLGRTRTSVSTTSSRHRQDAASLDAAQLDYFDRQVRAFGQTGQASLRSLSVGIVGAGGLGSIVIEQLVRSGVRRFVLVDFDKAESSNLTRVALLFPDDVRQGRLKVDVMADRIRELAADAEVFAIADSLYAERSLRALAGTDILIGCTDDSGSRFALNEVSLRFLRPYLDVGSGIHPGARTVFGGRYTFLLPGSGCLTCAQAIDVQQAARELRPRVLREAELRAGYIEGVPERAPAVMSLNGVVASLAVLEMQAWATGLRPARQQVVFDGATGEAKLLPFRPDVSCNECGRFLAAGDVGALVRSYRNA
jgi:molybdopterin/thiamine biosynthesis adenylyltransferase